MSLLLSFAALLLTIVVPTAAASPYQVGFEHKVTTGGIEVGIWYPAAGTPVRQRLGLHAQDVVSKSRVPGGRYPLVVISHGTGGDFTGHVDTALSLARAGFVVAALTHPGDNWRDDSRAAQIEDRPAALSATISYMLTKWPGHSSIDAGQIGAFGFSAGGFTVLAAAGGKPDLTRLADFCARNAASFVCGVLKSRLPAPLGVSPFMKDPRIKAIVVAAPAIGFTFGRAGLVNVRIPVQLWRADDDQVLLAPYYADAVRQALPNSPEFHSVPGAGHFDFLAPCVDASAKPRLCHSPPAFDRVAFHDNLNREVVRFFSAQLARKH